MQRMCVKPKCRASSLAEKDQSILSMLTRSWKGGAATATELATELEDTGYERWVTAEVGAPFAEISGATQERMAAEKLRISRELHDNIGAQITFIAPARAGDVVEAFDRMLASAGEDARPRLQASLADALAELGEPLIDRLVFGMPAFAVLSFEDVVLGVVDDPFRPGLGRARIHDCDDKQNQEAGCY